MEYQKALQRLTENLDNTNKLVDQLQTLVEDCKKIIKIQEFPPALVGSNLRCDSFPKDPEPHIKLTSVEKIGEGEQTISTFVSHTLKRDQVRDLVSVFSEFLTAVDSQEEKEDVGRRFEIFRLAQTNPANLKTRVDSVLGQIIVTYDAVP